MKDNVLLTLIKSNYGISLNKLKERFEQTKWLEIIKTIDDNFKIDTTILKVYLDCHKSYIGLSFIGEKFNVDIINKIDRVVELLERYTKLIYLAKFYSTDKGFIDHVSIWINPLIKNGEK